MQKHIGCAFKYASSVDVNNAIFATDSGITHRKKANHCRATHSAT